LVACEIVVKLLEAWVFVPILAVVLSAALSQAGRIAVSNRDILDFLRSPPGLLYAAVLSAGAMAMFLWEQAGIMSLVSMTSSPQRPALKQILRSALRMTWRVAQLGLVMAALLAMALSPFVLLAVLTYGLLLSEHDINFYLSERPPVFWLAGGIGALLVLAALAAGIWLGVRWAFALPILLFENSFARAALRFSRTRVRGVGWRVGLLLIGWLLGVLLLGTALEAGFRFFAARVLANAGEYPMARILLLLAAQAGLLAALSFLMIVGLALVTRRLYLFRSEQLDIAGLDRLHSAPEPAKPASLWTQLLGYLCIAFAVLAPMAFWADLSRHESTPPLARVTAHRGHSRAAPENTLSAIRKAVECGADYAEVDVQLTADGVVVLLHDSDLKRVASVPRRIGELTYNEVRKLDVGSYFDPSFAGERVPSLAEVINRFRERIKLNIEMKLYEPNGQLARAVARLVREHDFESDCLVSSFNYDALQEVKETNPRVRTGLIVAYALGDVSRLEVEALSVRANFLSDHLLRRAQGRGKEVHVWTVNDTRQMTRLLSRGVDNIITDDPDILIRVRDEWSRLTRTERLLLASRLLLGLDD
jgi:glycerophosphoryl diester phosphodiesterase